MATYELWGNVVVCAYQKNFDYKRFSQNVLCGSFEIGLFVSSDTCKGMAVNTRIPQTPYKQDSTGVVVVVVVVVICA